GPEPAPASEARSEPQGERRHSGERSAQRAAGRAKAPGRAKRAASRRRAKALGHAKRAASHTSEGTRARRAGRALRDWAPMLDAPVRRRRIALAGRGVELGVLDWGGDGPLALLHHANGFCAALWAPVAEELRARFRVVALDARGHGESSKPEGAAAYRWAGFGHDLAALPAHLAPEAG